jgi:UDP-N-acetylglucosamine--N-acetylmuramyl-(pentapeptide) pyrophosphoryl-undecaprenol N-acetylglucosamine transferase
VYPALTVAQAIRERAPADEIWYMGREQGIERTLAEQAGLPFEAIPAAPVRGAGPLRLLGNLADLLKGVSAAHNALRRLRPDAVFATGGYVSVPVVVAAWLRRIPSMVYLPDMEPGLAVRALALIAKRIAVTNEEAAKFFAARKVTVTGYPVRAEFGTLGRDEARGRLGVGAGKALLVFGGSRGASALNTAVERSLEDLLEIAEVIHVCGKEDYAALSQRRSALPADKQARYHLFEYLHDLPAAVKAADLVISRAGASILGEFTLAGAPSILVPYPYAGQHQMNNARYLTEYGAAVIVENDAVDRLLFQTARDLLGDGLRRAAMRQSALKLARPDAAHRLAEILKNLPTAEAV